MTKYMFVYLKTGGGHLAPARAVAESLSYSSDKIDVALVDGLSGSWPVARKAIEDGYRRAMNKAVWTYELLYAINKLKPFAIITAWMVALFIRPVVEREILRKRPRKIVIFHFFLIKPVKAVIKKYNLDCQLLVIVTDPFTAHPIWFIDKSLKYVVFSDDLKKKCLGKGIPERNIRVFPFVLSKSFDNGCNNERTNALREELGIPGNKKVILIMGGADGMPNGKRLIRKLVSVRIDAAIVVVCGRNKGFYKYSQKKKREGAENLIVFGYIDFIHSLLQMADLVVTKCGASSIMEILKTGKIPVISDYVWEQEKGNMEYVCKKEMGILEKRISRIPLVLDKLLKNNETAEFYRLNIMSAGIVNGADPLATYIKRMKNNRIRVI